MAVDLKQWVWAQDTLGRWYQKANYWPKGSKMKFLSQPTIRQWRVAGFLRVGKYPNKRGDLLLIGNLKGLRLQLQKNYTKLSHRHCDYFLDVDYGDDNYGRLARLWYRKIYGRKEMALLGYLGYENLICVVEQKGNLDNPNRAEYLVMIKPIKRKRGSNEVIEDKFTGWRDPKWELDYEALGIV